MLLNHLLYSANFMQNVAFTLNNSNQFENKMTQLFQVKIIQVCPKCTAVLQAIWIVWSDENIIGVTNFKLTL